MAIRVFIGSSSESKKHAYAVQAVLGGLLDRNAEIAVWDQGSFTLTESYLSSLMDEVDRCDFGVFIFAPNDTSVIRGEGFSIVRDNVVFEFGLFLGGLGTERTFFLKPTAQEDLHLPSDLGGIAAASFDPGHPSLKSALGPACLDIREAIVKAGARTDRKGVGQVEVVKNPRILCVCSQQYLGRLSEVRESFEALKNQIYQICRRFSDDPKVSGHFTEAPGVNSLSFKEVLLGKRYDIIQIGVFVSPVDGRVYFSDVDPNSGVAQGGRMDSIPSDGFLNLIESSGAKLVIMAACDSLYLASTLAKITNTIASTRFIGIANIVSWEQAFYKCLSLGASLSDAFETANSLNDHPMVLLMKKDIAFLDRA